MNHISNKQFEDIIESNIFNIPSINLAEYTIYGDKHAMCPFCNKVNNIRNPVSLYQDTSDKQTEYHTVYLCSNHESLYRRMRNNEVKKGVSNLSNPRIRNYLQKGIFGNDVEEYTFGMPKGGQCYFCNTLVYDSYVHFPVEQGRSTSDTIVGPVKSCHDCECVISENENLYKSLDLSTTDICIQCGLDYPITKREQDERTLKGTTGQHYCTECLDTWFNLLNKERLVEMQCEDCNNTTWIDRTLFPDLNTYRCSVHTHEDDNLFIYNIGNEDELQIVISGYYPVGNTTILVWDYVITDNETKAVLASSNKKLTDVMECAFIAGNIAEELLAARYKKQLKMF